MEFCTKFCFSTAFHKLLQKSPKSQALPKRSPKSLTQRTFSGGTIISMKFNFAYSDEWITHSRSKVAEERGEEEEDRRIVGSRAMQSYSKCVAKNVMSVIV